MLLLREQLLGGPIWMAGSLISKKQCRVAFPKSTHHHLHQRPGRTRARQGSPPNIHPLLHIPCKQQPTRNPDPRSQRKPSSTFPKSKRSQSILPLLPTLTSKETQSTRTPSPMCSVKNLQSIHFLSSSVLPPFFLHARHPFFPRHRHLTHFFYSVQVYQSRVTGL